MAINFTDFSRAPLVKSPWGNIFEDVLKGYQIEKEPAKMAEEQKQRELANGLKNLELQHKPKEYALSDQGTSLANSLKSKALEHYEEKFQLEKDYKRAQINKLSRAGVASGLKPNAAVANAEYVWHLEHPDDATLTPEEKAKHVDFVKNAFQTGLQHTAEGTERTKVLNDTQYNRGLTQISKKHDELRSIDQGNFPGTKEKLTPQQQTSMKKDLLLSLTKDITDPKTRERLINASNMNITLDSIEPKALTQYSGGKGQVNKLADSLIESFGKGSPQYQNYRRESIKASAAAKQMRQYLGDSIQPTAQERLDHLSNPEAWNVSPKLARENFEFIRDLYKRETQTLVRAATDPSLYTPEGNSDQRPEHLPSGSVSKESEPEIVSSANGLTTIRNGTRTFRIPDGLVDKYMIEHSEARFDER